MTTTGMTQRFGLLQGVIVLAAVTTALIHIVLAFQFPDGVDPIFILNGLGYLALVALLYLPLPALAGRRNLIRWLLIAYTLVTVVAWLFIGVRSTVAYLDKLIELVLIVALWLDGQRTRAGRI